MVSSIVIVIRALFHQIIQWQRHDITILLFFKDDHSFVAYFCGGAIWPLQHTLYQQELDVRNSEDGYRQLRSGSKPVTRFGCGHQWVYVASTRLGRALVEQFRWLQITGCRQLCASMGHSLFDSSQPHRQEFSNGRTCGENHHRCLLPSFFSLMAPRRNWFSPFVCLFQNDSTLDFS